VVLDSVDSAGRISLAFVPAEAYVPDSWEKLQSEDLSKMSDDEKKAYEELLAQLASFEFI